MKLENKKLPLGSILILLSGVLWGTMSIFVRRMDGYGFLPLETVCVRLTVAAIGFWIVLFRKDRDGIRKGLHDLPIFLATGLVSVLLFTWCYFSAIQMMNVSVAAILLYTSPIWVMLLSLVLFHERITRRKLLALCLAFLGCVLVSGISGGITPLGFLFGIGAGIGYGLYSIFGTIALKKHSSYAVTAFSFTIAAIGAWCIATPQKVVSHFLTPIGPEILLVSVIMGIVTAFLPFLFYTFGLKTVEASRAAILATIEPLVATLVGLFCFHETIGLWSYVGIACIFAAILVLSVRSHQSKG